MPKISKIRIVNLTYNDTRHIYNQIFDCFNGENTLMTLANGGGKTVLVQMAMQPVLPNQKLKTRQFKSYFDKSPYPTYIMTEWLLDNNNGKLLTGIGVRKISRISKGSSETTEELKIITFTHEYKYANEYDIDNIPVTIEENGQTRMIPFDEIEKKFSAAEKGNGYKFKLFRNWNSEDRARYAAELNSYKISQDEFKEFIVKINEQEGGLDTYFEKRKTSKALINAEFLPLIESRLNKEGNTIKNIRELIGNHAENLVRNEGILEEKEVYERFKIKSQEILVALEQYDETLKSITDIEGQIGNLYAYFKREFDSLKQKETDFLIELETLNNQIIELSYEKASHEYYVDNQALSFLRLELKQLEESHNQLEVALAEQELIKGILECAKLYQEYLVLDAKIIENEANLRKEQIADKELEVQIQDIKYTLNQKYAIEVEEASNKVKDTQSQIQAAEFEDRQVKYEKAKNEENLKEVNRVLKDLNDAISKFRAKEDQLRMYPEFTLSVNLFTGEYAMEEVEEYRQLLKQMVDSITKAITEMQALKDYNTSKIREAQEQIVQLTGESQKHQSELKQMQQKLDEFEVQKEEALRILNHYALGESDLFNKDKIVSVLDSEIDSYNQLIKQYNLDLDALNKDLAMYESGRTLQLPKDLLDFLESNYIYVEFGFEWLKNYNNTLEAKREMVENNPFIPYSLILTHREFERVKELNLDVFTSMTIPILERESLEQHLEVKSLNQIYSLGDVHFLMSFNQELLDEVHLAILIDSIKQKIASVEHEIQNAEKSIANVTKDKSFFEQVFTWTSVQIEELEILARDLSEKIAKAHEDIERLKGQIQMLGEANKKLEEDIKIEEKKLFRANQQTLESEELFKAYEVYIENYKQRSIKESEQEQLTETINKLSIRLSKLSLDLNDLSHKVREEEKVLTELKSKAAVYSKATSGIPKSGSILDLEAELRGYTEQQGVKVDWLTKQIADDEAQQAKIKAQIDKYGFEESEYTSVEFSDIELRTAEKQIPLLKKEKGSVHDRIVETETTIKVDGKNLTKKREEIAKRFDGREPLDISLILQINFDEREQQLLSKRESVQAELGNVKEVVEKYDTWVKSMDDYKQFTENLTSIEPIEVPDKDAYKRELLYEYKNKQNEGTARKEQVSRLYSLAENEFVGKSPIFKQLFESILYDERKYKCEYGSNAINRANLQIDLKLEQYNVDYANIQSMEDNIINMAYGYVLNVYSELSSMDSNSTIEIDGVRRKMLELHLPDKAKLEEMLLKQYVKGTISNCTSLIKQDKPYETLLNSEISTDRLFDRLVDLNRVDVMILKVEQNKTKLMTWVEASDMSGGEAFVSIFVVFVTLMSYLRGGSALKSLRGNDEGKVLIMDNPFGKITSEHLLIPMFSIAKKYNTQLICLTDIDKHTVCDRFDVIYGIRIEKEIGRDHEYLDVRLEKNEAKQEENLASSLFKIEQKQLSMF